MPTNSHFKRPLRWFFRPRLSSPLHPSTALQNWLLDEGSLTTKLVKLSHGQFRVEVLRQVFGRVALNEAQALGIDPHHLCLIREVILRGQGQPWVFARSIFPVSSLTGSLRHLRKQGSRSLGAFLFSQPHLERSPIALSLISRHHAYVPEALLGNAQAWGRRSIFSIDNKPLLVSEVFLPSFPGNQ